MSTNRDADTFSSMRASVSSKSAQAETSLREANQTLAANRLLTTALQRVSEDWKQPAEQIPMFVVINRWSLVKSNLAYWAEEMIDDLELAKKGRPRTYVGGDEFSPPVPSEDLVPVPIGPLSAAEQRQCATCTSSAYLVCWRHEEDHDESFGGRIHNKMYLLCPTCKDIAPLNNNTCHKCV